jgi:hypothetical protein
MTVISFLRACYGTPGGHVRWLDEAKAIGEGHEASEDAERDGAARWSRGKGPC